MIVRSRKSKTAIRQEVNISRCKITNDMNVKNAEAVNF